MENSLIFSIFYVEDTGDVEGKCLEDTDLRGLISFISSNNIHGLKLHSGLNINRFGMLTSFVL